mmetsp:Transcript_6921/g.22683  ORF Transcript_6921/g.22683 Transcript_6921/m.22683 type:complete len:256 (-) Transcript_6921:299-1066(-)
MCGGSAPSSRSIRARCSTSSCVWKSSSPVQSSVRMQPIDQRSTAWPQPMPSVTSGGRYCRVHTTEPSVFSPRHVAPPKSTRRTAAEAGRSPGVSALSTKRTFLGTNGRGAQVPSDPTLCTKERARGGGGKRKRGARRLAQVLTLASGPCGSARPSGGGRGRRSSRQQWPGYDAMRRIGRRPLSRRPPGAGGAGCGACRRAMARASLERGSSGPGEQRCQEAGRWARSGPRQRHQGSDPAPLAEFPPQSWPRPDTC